jgi:hypothetical protein
LFYMCWYVNYIPVPCYTVLFCFRFLSSALWLLVILIFLLFSLTGVFPYPRHN